MYRLYGIGALYPNGTLVRRFFWYDGIMTFNPGGIVKKPGFGYVSLR